MLTKLQKLRSEKEEGFTLIELLVVILIIGILSAIAIPAFTRQRVAAIETSIQSDLSSVAKEIDTLVIKTGGQLKNIKVNTPNGADIAHITAGTAGVDPTVQLGLSKGNIIEGMRISELAGNTNIGYQLAGLNDNTSNIYYWDSAAGGAQW